MKLVDAFLLLVRRNQQGVWFVTDDDGHYLPLPRRLWASLNAAVQNPREP